MRRYEVRIGDTVAEEFEKAARGLAFVTAMVMGPEAQELTAALDKFRPVLMKRLRAARDSWNTAARRGLERRRD